MDLLRLGTCASATMNRLLMAGSTPRYSKIPAVHRLDVRNMSGPAKGQIASKTPAKIRCEAGKSYNWCACGLSSKQPLCDGSHKRSTSGLTPFPFIARETKEYFFCNCKQTNNRPLCDGTHKKL